MHFWAIKRLTLIQASYKMSIPRERSWHSGKRILYMNLMPWVLSMDTHSGEAKFDRGILLTAREYRFHGVHCVRRKSQQSACIFDSIWFVPGGVARGTGAAWRITNTRKRSYSRKSLVVPTGMRSSDSNTFVRGLSILEEHWNSNPALSIPMCMGYWWVWSLYWLPQKRRTKKHTREKLNKLYLFSFPPEELFNLRTLFSRGFDLIDENLYS